MSKELIISVSSQETKVAILEDGEVVELHIERNRDKEGIVGSICKGRVTKVLPGMQSAFVDIGLERDAFLYVSDFFEDTEEYDKIVSSAEEKVAKLEDGTEGAKTDDLVSPDDNSNISKQQDRRVRPRYSRRTRTRGKRYEETAPKHTELAPTALGTISEPSTTAPRETQAFCVLPGESLAKHQTTRANSLTPKAATEPASSELTERDSSEVATTSHQGGTDESVPSLDSVDNPEAELILRPHSPESPIGTDPIEPISELPSPDIPEPDTEKQKLAPIESSTTATAQENQTEGAASSTLEDQPSEIPPIPAIAKKKKSLSTKKPATMKDVTPGKSLEADNREQPTGQKVSSVPETTDVSDTPPNPTTRSRGVKAQHRSRPNTPKFIRRSPDRGRRKYNSQDRRDRESTSKVPMIADLLKKGQEILIQISREPLGSKGARITSHIALPGRYLVYMPTVDHIGVSRKIDVDEERQRLKKIILDNRVNLPGGFIVRTAGEHKGEDEFKSDIKFLHALWADIKSQSEQKVAPAIIHRELNLIQRMLRDQLTKEFTTIRVDSELEYASIVELINQFQPTLVNRVKLYTKEPPIFEEFGVQAEVDKAMHPKVWLESGGYIVIDQAEALVAIDVNTGRYVGKSNKLEDTIARTNVEAAKEIAHQLRLRDLGGIIVCDFIDMEDRKNRLKVTQTLEEALRKDKSPSKVLQFNDFGLVAITRKRVKQSLLKILCEPCSECSGSGMVKSPQTVCYEIQEEARKMASTIEDKEMTIRVSPEVAKALKTTESSIIDELEASLRKEVVIKSDLLLSQERFDIF